LQKTWLIKTNCDSYWGCKPKPPKFPSKPNSGCTESKSIAPQCAEIKLKALVGEVVDTTRFAQTAKPGFIIALRVLFLPEFWMASGVIFSFAACKEQRLLRKWWKKSRD
jgi:hypothetical protein